MNFHQTTEDIIKNATAEQRILWNSIFLKFGDKIGVSQFEYCGAVAGGEFLIYNQNKLYFALELAFGPHFEANTAPAANLYDSNNVIMFGLTNAMEFWNATTVARVSNSLLVQSTNLIFSRVVVFVYTQIKFIGYRLSI